MKAAAMTGNGAAVDTAGREVADNWFERKQNTPCQLASKCDPWIETFRDGPFSAVGAWFRVAETARARLACDRRNCRPPAAEREPSGTSRGVQLLSEGHTDCDGNFNSSPKAPCADRVSCL
jgi:hypothetical protein